MKKIWVILCTMIMLFSINISVYAKEEMTLSVGEVKANGNETVTVPIILSNNGGICGMALSIEYDDGLKLVEVNGGNALSSMVFTKPGDLTAVPIRLLWDGVEDDTTNGTIATLKFVTPKKEGTYKISISYEKGEIVDGMLNPVSINIKNGTIQVGEVVDKPLFTDVFENAWYYDAVNYVYEEGLITGTSDVTFEPNSPMTRGMLVTVLYRKEGRPEVPATTKFSDVESNKYYAKPITWASEKNIVSGYKDGTFGPNDSITREQIAKVLFRYAEYKGYDVTASQSLSNYKDASKVSSYAVKYMEWATAEGLIKGSNGVLNPKGDATRAEIAAMLRRFIEKYE